MFFAAYMRDGVIDINDPGAYSIGDLQPYFYQAVAPVAIEGLDLKEQLLFRTAALAGMHAFFSDRKPLLMKTHYANELMDCMPTIPPALTNRALYVVRDPRDLVFSYAEHFKCHVNKAIELLNDPAHCAGRPQELNHHLNTWSEHVRSWLATNAFPVARVRYEDLLDDPVKNFASILRFFEMDPDMDRVERAVENSSFDKLQMQEVENGFREKPFEDGRFFREGGKGYWEQNLTEEQINWIEEPHQEMMKECGYDTRTL
jgi:hypothetical protein